MEIFMMQALVCANSSVVKHPALAAPSAEDPPFLPRSTFSHLQHLPYLYHPINTLT